MTEVLAELSEDRRVVKLALPAESAPLEMTAEGLEAFLRQLSGIRADMQPGHPEGGVREGTQISALACSRWSMVVGEGGASQARVYLLHPGFGWIWIDLDRRGADRLVDALGRHFRPKPPDA